MRIKQSGATIVVVISVIAVLAIFTGAALDYTFTMGKNVERTNKMAAEQAIANGCIQQDICTGGKSAAQRHAGTAWEFLLEDPAADAVRIPERLELHRDNGVGKKFYGFELQGPSRDTAIATACGERHHHSRHRRVWQ